MILKIIDTPSLGDVAQGLAGLYAIEAQGFGPDGRLLLVKVAYLDSAYQSTGTRTAFWTYDLRLEQYSACINTLIAIDRPIEVSDVAIASYQGKTQFIASYRDTGATGLDLNKLALIRDGVLIESDLVAKVTGNHADAMIDAIRVSADGRFVALETAARTLVAELDTNEHKDIFLFDLDLNTSRLISSSNGAASGADSLLGDVMIGADGSLSIAFQSANPFTTLGVDGNEKDDVFVWRLLPSEFKDASAGTISLVSRTAAGAAGGTNPMLNTSGVVFTSDSAAFSSADQDSFNDVWQTVGASVVLVSANDAGALSGATSLASTSDSGKYVAVMTASPEVAGQTAIDQLVLVDTVTHTELVVSQSSAGDLANDAVISPVLSADGTQLAFSSQASNLIAGVNDGQWHLYVADSNNAGVVAINGTPRQGQALSLTLSDADGLGAQISYQWLADHIAVSGATASSFMPGEAQVGKVMTVVASYTDGVGRAEFASSSATAPVLNVNDAPTGSVNFTGTLESGQTLSAVCTLADADGLGTISYQWQANGVGISGATGSTYVLTDTEFGKTITVEASYIDGHGTPESVTGGFGKNVDLLAYSWKTHTLLESVVISGASQTYSTNTSGAANLTAVIESSVNLTVSRAIPVAETAATSSAVNLQDAIAILKMIVGLPVNGASQALSPYQTLAADFDGNGTVGLTDAIGVLKHVVGLSAPDPTWHFVNEADTSVPSKTTLSPGTPQSTVATDLSGASPVHVGLVGYLSGDVDGSYAGPAGALDLDVTQPTYIAALVGSHPGLTASQFGG